MQLRHGFASQPLTRTFAPSPASAGRAILATLANLAILATLASLSTLLLPSRAHAIESPPPVSEIQLDRAENNTLYFKLPEGSKLPPSLKTDLFDLHPLGRIRSPEGLPPYFVLTGKPCQDCMEDSAVYLIRPTQSSKPVTLVHPGKILDSRTRQMLLESRAFFGRCLSARTGEVYVVFQKERIDKKHKMMQSVFIAEPGKEVLEERLLERGFPSLQDVLRHVKAKSCKEIEGRNRVMLKKTIDTRRNLKQTDDEDDSEDEKAPSETAPAEKA